MARKELGLWFRGWMFLCVSTAVCEAGEEMTYAGMRAMVVRPENSYCAYDSTIYGALVGKGMEVVWGEPSALEDAQALAQFDLVATNMKRSFTDAQVAGLKAYLDNGGALYGSWGGPMNCPDLLKICGASRAGSLRLKEMALLDGPLTKGLGEQKLLFPEFAGDTKLGLQWNKEGYEIVNVEPLEGAVVVARDPEGRSLGILSRCGKGRAAVLGFGPENPKFFFRDPRTAAVVLDNLLQWLLPPDQVKPRWSNAITVNLPARAEVQSVAVEGVPVANPTAKRIGSIKEIRLDSSAVLPEKTATIRIGYRPLVKARNVETILHLPGGSSLTSFDTGAKAAEFVASMNATMVQPLLRSSGGTAWYRGMPEDVPDKKIVAEYKGNWLAEFVEECHKRGIKVIGGIYFEYRTTLKKYPEAARIGKDGKPAGPTAVCFNNPKGQEHNLNTIRQLLDNYKLDGMILDDNFELDHNPCYCDYCKGQFREYCGKRGIAYEDPSTMPNADTDLTRAWREYWTEASSALAGKVRAIVAEHGLPTGGWVGPGMKPTHLAASFDFLGGMTYTAPACSARGPLSVLGNCGYITLLWGLNRPPAEMEAEVPEAIRAGSTTVGFWIWLRGVDGSKENRGFITRDNRGYGIEPGGLDAMARAMGRAETDWLAFYRDNLIGGDARFVVTSARLGREEMVLTVKNLGRKAERRVEGAVDLSAIE